LEEEMAQAPSQVVLTAEQQIAVALIAEV